MSYALFHMGQSLKEHLIARHNFYIEQANKRLLSQFQNMENEAEEYANEWLEKHSQYFDPDRHDPGIFYEQSYDESVEFYQMLDDMLSKTKLSIVAGIFHEWDKQLRNWLIVEVNHWHRGDAVKKAIWRANFCMIFDLLEGFGWSIKSKSYYTSLDRCRLVVNTFKHGDGDSFNTIKDKHPEFIDSLVKKDNYFDYISLINSDSVFLSIANYTHLKIEDAHIVEFSDAIIEFWKDVPEYIRDNESFNLPEWFRKAIQ